MNSMILLRAAAYYINRLAAKGVEVEYFCDFQKLPEVAREVDRAFQQPAFDVTRIDPTVDMAFWLFMVVDGKRIGGVAALKQVLGRESYESYIKRIFQGQYGVGVTPLVLEVAQPLNEKLSGTLAYIGELSVLRSHQNDRERQSLFLRLVQLLALLRWDVDWVYAFMDDRHVKARKDRVYGFTQMLQRPHVWSGVVPENRYKDEWWVGTPRSDLEHIFRAEVLSEEAKDFRVLQAAIWSWPKELRDQLFCLGARGQELNEIYSILTAICRLGSERRSELLANLGGELAGLGRN